MATNGFFVESVKGGTVTHSLFSPIAAAIRQFSRRSGSRSWTFRDVQLARGGQTRGLVVYPSLEGNTLEMVALLRDTIPGVPTTLRPAAQFRLNSWSRKQEARGVAPLVRGSATPGHAGGR